MTLHKLSAGTGYEYLTRQVAAVDSTELGRTRLADYYSTKGEAPGRWTGSGLAGVDGIAAGDVVTADQMKHLFGTGSHPVTGAPLGRAFRVYGTQGVDGFNAEVAQELEAAHQAAVADALAFLEKHAIFTREGTNDVRPVETRGLVAMAFTHRDSVQLLQILGTTRIRPRDPSSCGQEKNPTP